MVVALQDLFRSISVVNVYDEEVGDTQTNIDDGDAMDQVGIRVEGVQRCNHHIVEHTEAATAGSRQETIRSRVVAWRSNECESVSKLVRHDCLKGIRPDLLLSTA